VVKKIMGKNRSILLYPFSLVYGAITGIRNFLYNVGIIPSTEFRTPVICVGNITVGGTGKTPHTEYLVRLLSKHFRVATLSRGYKRETRDFRIASASSTVREVGDEPLQIFRKFPEIIVAVDRNRVNGVRKILETDRDIQVILLDDAYQHRRIRPGFSILLTDYKRLIIKDHMLPYGNLRESASNMDRANIILVTKSPSDLSPIDRRIIVKEMNKEPGQNLYFTTVIYEEPVPVFTDSEDNSLTVRYSDLKESGIVLVTGIANPLPLKDHLQKYAGEIVHLSFPDHHNYNESDIASVSRAFNDLKTATKFIFTTEKDAVRLREFTNIAEPFRSAFCYLPVGIGFLNDDREEFDNLIIEYVRTNK
jgi:tetraacyldisaccharide 4'-kinase